MRKLLSLVVVCCVTVLSTLRSLHAAEFVVSGGDFKRVNTPLWCELPASLTDAKHLVVTDSVSGKSIPGQISEDRNRFVFILQSPIRPGEFRKFSVVASEETAVRPVRVVEADGRFDMQIAGRTILAYHTETVFPPQEADPIFRRSGHIHPFITPSGRVITDDFPSDHYHQHAVFAAWTKTEFEGEPVDFWNQAAGTGNVEHREVLEAVSGTVFASLKVRLAHVVTKSEPRDVLSEIWTIRLFNITDFHLFEIESVQTCVAETPLTIKEYHYGGFGFRGSQAWIRNPAHKIITNETDDREVGNHTRPRWTAITGPVEGQPCSAAMFSCPENFRSPQPVRLHPTMPYFVYSPCVLGEFKLQPGNEYRSRYQYVACDGEPEHELMNQIWANIHQPPSVEWTSE